MSNLCMMTQSMTVCGFYLLTGLSVYTVHSEVWALCEPKLLNRRKLDLSGNVNQLKLLIK